MLAGTASSWSSGGSRPAASFVMESGPVEFAHRLGVSRQSATRWHRTWQESGAKGLRKAETTGRRSRLMAADVRR